MTKELPSVVCNPWRPLAIREFKASLLQAPVADIAAARPPRRGLAGQPVPMVYEKLADIRGVHGGADGVVYMEAKVKLDRAGRGALAYGADAPVKVWVNGRVADCQPQATNPALDGEHLAPVSWKKGANRIAFALSTNHGLAWGVQAGVILEPVMADETPAGVPPVSWVPLPRRAKIGKGTLSLNAATRIVAADPALAPLAKILAAEIEALTGKQFPVSDRKPVPGDIVLGLDRKLQGEAYAFGVGRQATVRAGNYAAVAAGTVTLLQALRLEKNSVALPCVTVRDEPKSPYRGLMIDLARQWHSIENVKEMVVLCRWYKINYLHLHFTDTGTFTFPSKAYPKLQTPGACYTVEQLCDLEAFARDRGVIILPELEMPGHATIMGRQMPGVFAHRTTTAETSICPSRERVYEALDKLVGEMTDIFRTTPYFHIGADEVDMAPWKACADCVAYMAKHRISDARELYRHFIVRMNKIVRKHGKQMIVWEGFHKEGKIRIPRDVTVMEFESSYQVAPDLLAQGYPVINASWQPLYVVGGGRMWPPSHIYGWNQYRWESCWEGSKAYGKPIDVKPTDLVRGAQLCSWEQGERIELRTLRSRVPALSERLWNPGAGRSYADFNRRFVDCDPRLDRLIKG